MYVPQVLLDETSQDYDEITQEGDIFRIAIMPSGVVYRTLLQINILSLPCESSVALEDFRLSQYEQYDQ